MGRFHFLRVAGLAAAVVMAGTTAQAASCPQPGGVTTLKVEAAAGVNAARQAKGRTALRRDARLDKAAQDQACWMARTGQFSHYGAGNSTPKTRARQLGYCVRLVAENLAQGQRSGPSVVAAWMASPKHRDNIMIRKTQDYGLGVSLVGGKVTWVMVFGRPC